jgi:hypothetical protein
VGRWGVILVLALGVAVPAGAAAEVGGASERAAPRPSAVITTPRARAGAKYAPVQFKQPIVVTFRNVPSSDVIWVLVRTRGGLVYPQLTCPKSNIGSSMVGRSVGQSSGVWRGTLYLGPSATTGRGQLFSISLALAGTQANNALIEATRGWCGTTGWQGLDAQQLPLDLLIMPQVVHAKRV